MIQNEGGNVFFENDEEQIAFKEFTDNDEDFMIYLSWLRIIENIKMIGRQEYLLTIDVEEIKKYVKRLNLSSNDSFFKVYYVGKFIGTFKVGHIDWLIRSADLGIMIGDQNYRNKGLSIKIMLLGIRYAFDVLGLRRLTGGCYADNFAMCKCFETCGFKLEGRRREAAILGNKYTDHILYGLLKKDVMESSN